MCGITGFYTRNKDSKYTAQTLSAMARTLSHRGPDDQGHFCQDGHVGLANTRLSIIDLSSGHQPFISDDGNIVVVQNGEIYKFLRISL